MRTIFLSYEEAMAKLTRAVTHLSVEEVKRARKRTRVLGVGNAGSLFTML